VGVLTTAGQAAVRTHISPPTGRRLPGDLLIWELKNIDLPQSPDAELKLYFGDRALSDVWIEVSWGMKPGSV
jgi:hypothetical protein